MPTDAFNGGNSGLEIVPSLDLRDVRRLPYGLQRIDLVVILLNTNGIGRDEIFRDLRSREHEKGAAGYLADSERLFLWRKGSEMGLFFRHGIAEKFEKIGDYGFRVLPSEYFAIASPAAETAAFASVRNSPLSAYFPTKIGASKKTNFALSNTPFRTPQPTQATMTPAFFANPTCVR